MSGVQQRLNLKRTPIDTWSLREQLTLASAVLKSGDQNWVTVSRMMKQFAEPGRPHDWINQKTCAAQYNLLEERFDIKRPKRGEKIEAGESPMELIVKKLSQERIEELGMLEIFKYLFFVYTHFLFLLQKRLCPKKRKKY